MSDMNIEQQFEELEAILKKMDDPSLSLEESFEEYKKGLELLKMAGETIDRVEKKVLVLKEEGGFDEL